MATSINIDFDGFGFLDDSDDCAVDVSKMSPSLTTALKEQKQPPISPIESESSSGISSLDSDDLKKQLLSSPPTISISHDEEEEDADADRESSSGSVEKEQTDSGADGDDEELDSSESVEGDNDENDDRKMKNDNMNEENNDKEEEKQQQQQPQEQQQQKNEENILDSHELNEAIGLNSASATPSSPLADANKTKIVITTSSTPQSFSAPKMQVMFKNRDILDLGANIGVSRYEFVQYTVLPENNISCFFQNRAQYWRLGNGDEKEMPDVMIKCSNCDFTFPSINNNLLNQQGQALGKNKNSITDSLLTFLKNHHADYNTFNAMPNSININNNNNNNNISSAHNAIFNANGHNMKRMYNNNAPYVAYQMIQQQQQQFPNNAANSFYATGMNGWNNQAPPQAPMSQQHLHQQQQQQQQMSLFGNGGNSCGSNSNNNNNSNGYNGTALAILNLMNPSQRNLANTFQAMNNNTSRYYNNMNTTNNGFGLYKQF